MALRGVAKGATFEQAVAEFLGTERRHQRGNQDRGDIVHKTWTIECVAPGRGKPLDLATKMKEAEAEAARAGTPDRFCVVARKTGKPTGEAYCVVPLRIAREVFL